MNFILAVLRTTRHREAGQRWFEVVRFAQEPRPAHNRGAVIVRILCGRCSQLAAVIEDHDGMRMIRAGRDRYTVARLDVIACGQHGQLDVSWDVLRPVADNATRTITVRAQPVSMP